MTNSTNTNKLDALVFERPQTAALHINKPVEKHPAGDVFLDILYGRDVELDSTTQSRLDIAYETLCKKIGSLTPEEIDAHKGRPNELSRYVREKLCVNDEERQKFIKSVKLDGLKTSHTRKRFKSLYEGGGDKGLFMKTAIPFFCECLSNDDRFFLSLGDGGPPHMREITAVFRVLRRIGLYRFHPFYYPHDAILLWGFMKRLDFDTFESIATAFQCFPGDRKLNENRDVADIPSDEKDIADMQTLVGELAKISPGDANLLAALKNVLQRIVPADRKAYADLWRDKAELKELYYKSFCQGGSGNKSADSNINAFFRGNPGRLNRTSVLFMIRHSPQIGYQAAQDLLCLHRHALIYQKASAFENNLSLLLQYRDHPERCAANEIETLEKSLDELLNDYI